MKKTIGALLYVGVIFTLGFTIGAYANRNPSLAVVQGAQGEIAVTCADTVKAEDGEVAWGNADYATRTITVECGLFKNFNVQVVSHERCHFALSDTHTYIREFVDDSVSAEILEERICDAMGMGLR